MDRIKKMSLFKAHSMSIWFPLSRVALIYLEFDADWKKADIGVRTTLLELITLKNVLPSRLMMFDDGKQPNQLGSKR